MQIDVGEQGGDDATLRGSFLAWYEFDPHHDTAFQEAADECQHPFVRYPACHLPKQSLMRDGVKTRADISFNHPGILYLPVKQRVQGLDAVHRAASCAEAIGEVEKVCLPNRLQRHFQQGLHDPIPNSGNTQLPCLVRPWLGDFYPSDGFWPERPCLQFRLKGVNELLASIGPSRSRFSRHRGSPANSCHPRRQ
jgi:hypothetical protein